MIPVLFGSQVRVFTHSLHFHFICFEYYCSNFSPHCVANDKHYTTYIFLESVSVPRLLSSTLTLQFHSFILLFVLLLLCKHYSMKSILTLWNFYAYIHSAHRARDRERKYTLVIIMMFKGPCDTHTHTVVMMTCHKIEIEWKRERERSTHFHKKKHQRRNSSNKNDRDFH